MGSTMEEFTDHNIIIVLCLAAIAMVSIFYMPEMAKDICNTVVSGLLGMAYGGSIRKEVIK